VSWVSLRGRMIRGTAYSLTAIVVSKLAYALNSVVVSRMLGSENLGVLVILWNVLALAGIFATCGMPAAVVKLTAERGLSDPFAASEIVSASLLITAVSATATGVIVILFSPLIASTLYQEPSLAWLIPIGVVALVVSSVPAPAFALFQGFQKIRELNLRGMLYSIISVVLMIAFVWRLNLFGAAIAGVVIAFANVLINLQLLRSIWTKAKLSLRWPSQRTTFRSVGRLGSGFVASNVAVMAATFAGSTILVTTRSFQDLGYFSIALALAGYLTFIPTAIGVPMVPAVSEAYAGTEDKLAPFVTKTLRLVALGVLPPAFLLQFLAVPVVGILYGSEYASATGLVVWMAAGAYMISLASVVGFAILGVGDVWSGIGLNAVWGASYVGFAAFLVGGYGSLGLTVAFILAYGCLLGGALWYARRHLRIRGQDVVPPVALGLAILGAGIVMQAYVDDRLRIAVGLTGAGILTLVGWKWLSRQEKAILLAAMKSIRSKVWRPHSDHERSDPK